MTHLNLSKAKSTGLRNLNKFNSQKDWRKKDTKKAIREAVAELTEERPYIIASDVDMNKRGLTAAHATDTKKYVWILWDSRKTKLTRSGNFRRSNEFTFAPYCSAEKL